MIHNKTKKFPCVVCEKKFGKKWNLTNHIEMIHNKTKKFICVVCQKKFGKKWNLINHTKRIHNVSTFCNQSKKKF